MTTLGIQLEPHGDRPMFLQLFDAISERIRRGTYPPGYRLPPTRSLADELGAHRNTVVHAYRELEAAGLIQSTVGRGTFVAPRREPEPASPPPDRGGLPWGALVARAVTIEPLDRAERLTRVRAGPADLIRMDRMQASADLFPVDELKRCVTHVMRTVGARALAYTPRGGIDRLRELIAIDLRRQGVPASQEDLVITTGSTQGLDLMARALVNPGDTFLVDESTYAGALTLFSTAGARLVGVRGDDEGPDLASLESASRTRPKGYYVMPGSQNPTGTQISLERRRELVDWSHRLGIPLIEDDYSADLRLDDSPPLPALRSLDGEVIYLGTYSKKLMPALRIGYLLCPPALHKRLTALKYAMDLGTSGLLQYVLAELLERGTMETHLSRLRTEYRRRRDALHGALQKALPSDVHWHLPTAGLALWLPLGGLDSETIAEEAHREGVAIGPGALNQVTPDAPPGIRLTYCAEPPARLIEGARRLGRAWTRLAQRNKPRRGGGTAEHVLSTV
jgi:DNA-binding transcriptional MocR family regulator